MVIWPVSALRMAAKAHEELYDGIRKDGGTHRLIDRMQTRAELYATIGYHEYEALEFIDHHVDHAGGNAASKADRLTAATGRSQPFAELPS